MAETQQNEFVREVAEKKYEYGFTTDVHTEIITNGLNEDIVSLNINAHLLYKVKCYEINDPKDFAEKIETFFNDRCLDKHYLCEPFGETGYNVSFSCEDICFQFKRYMLTLKRIDKNYLNSKCELVPIDKTNLINSKIKNINYIRDFGKIYYIINEHFYFNKGPYMTFDEMKRIDEKEGKKKWIDKNGFKV